MCVCVWSAVYVYTVFFLSEPAMFQRIFVIFVLLLFFYTIYYSNLFGVPTTY